MKIKIVSYHTKYAKYFYDYNIEWLETFFYVEPYDQEVLSQPEKYIINKGGYMFFAKIKEQVLGTVALMPTENNGILELTKMAVLREARGKKIGQKLLQHCINFARKEQLDALMLYSNTKLENAIYLYRKYGFTELELETNNPYERADIKMSLKL